MSSLAVLLLATSLGASAQAATALTGDAALVCDSTKAGYIRWNGSQFQGCDGNAWIQLAGGSKTTYLGATTTKYNGNLGGYTGANVKCVAEFGAGARMMTAVDFYHIAGTQTYTNGWLNNYGANYVYAQSCYDWRNETSAAYGIIYESSSTGFATILCNVMNSIHCVKD
jgi:hypothetical protein